LNARAAALNGELRRVRIIDTAGMDASEVRIGTRVELERAGTRRVLTLLGPWESKPEEDVISYESDLGQRILGEKVGSTVEVGGEAWTVAAIQPHR
jgi:transcription elongation GreA/GreB family factor